MEISKLDKVKKGLECLAQKQEPMTNPCSKCDYHDRPNFAFCVVDVATDAIAMLEEQKPKQVNDITQQISCFSGICPSCGKMLNTTCNKNFCGFCGQAVKLE